MILFRASLKKLEIPFWGTSSKNLLLGLVFFYFLLSSADIFNVEFASFKFKLTNIISIPIFIFCLWIFKNAQASMYFFVLSLLMLINLCVSAVNSINKVVCIGFIFFFIFNYLFYFLLPSNFFRYFEPEKLFKTYQKSFYCIGIYALCQIIFSLMGVKLFGAKQSIFGIARGQALSYEPSYYALYMTPFAIYKSTEYLLKNKSHRKLAQVFWPNFFLLISTSTGCFFSYLFFLLFVSVFRIFKLVQSTQISIRNLVIKFSMVSFVSSLLLWFIKKDLVVSGFLKFFYSGIRHFSLLDRWNGLVEYWNIFLENPLFGVGLGAGPYYLIIEKYGLSIPLDKNMMSRFSPMNVTTEILASLGIVGGILFSVFFAMLIRKFVQVLKIHALSEEERRIYLSLSLSICVMFATLQFNQSIMRCYMWIHVGLFYGYADYLMSKYSFPRSSLSV